MSRQNKADYGEDKRDWHGKAGPRGMVAGEGWGHVWGLGKKNQHGVKTIEERSIPVLRSRGGIEFFERGEKKKQKLWGGCEGGWIRKVKVRAEPLIWPRDEGGGLDRKLVSGLVLLQN